MGRHRRPGRYRSSVYAAVGAAVTGTVTVTSTMAAAAAVHTPPKPRNGEPETETLLLGSSSDSAERTSQLAARQAAAALQARQAQAAAAAAAARAKALAEKQAELRKALAAAAQARKARETALAARYSARATSLAERILEIAASQAGKPYQWGAAGPNAYDCSGFTQWVFNQVGISLPHNSGAQYDTVKHIPASEVQPGDLVFVFDGPNGAVSHVAIYAGDGYWWEAPHPGATVGKDKAWSTNVAYGSAF